MSPKRRDHRNIIIGVLASLVIIEAFFLFVYKPKKVAVVKKKEERPAVIKQVPPPAALPKKAILGRIAIIVDDCGYNLQPCTFSSLIKYPVTFSILPNLKHSTDVAECAHQNKKEVMLHLPMEPHHNLDKYPENYIIKTSMKKTKIEEIINAALKSVPFAAGVNNHMGSKATEDRKVMAIVFSALQKKELFFVDSLVTNQSVCQTLANEMNLSFTHRDIFLDNQNERSYIENQFALLKEEVKKNGYAVAIGHARTLTLQIIKEQTELLEKEGFKFVAVKDMIDKQ